MTEPITPEPDEIEQPDDDYNFEPAWLNDFLRMLPRHNGIVAKACEELGHDNSVLYHHYHRQPAFKAAFEQARADARQAWIHELEDEIRNLAGSGDIEHIRELVTGQTDPGNDRSRPTIERIKITRRMHQLLLILERLAPDRWAQKQPELERGAEAVQIRFRMSDRDEPGGQIEDAEVIEQPALPAAKETPDGA